jgi:flagellar hook-length control protein FliK
VIDTAALAAVLAAEARIAPLAAIEEVSGRLPQFTPGQQVQAQVDALNAVLPENVQPGETLALTFVGDAPRLTFALAREPAGATLSQAGRLIDSVLSQSGNNPMATIAGARPLSGVGEPQPQRLALALRQSIETSGLFYESHLAQWVAGRQSIEPLQREPQAHWLAMQHPASAQASEPQHIALPGNAPALHTVPSRIEAAATADVHDARAALPAEALPVMRNQLDALETRQFAWHGEVWPGQWAHWQVGEQSDDTRHDSVAQRQWHTELRLVLPRLGEVSAELQWRAGGLMLSIRTEDAATASRLRDGLGELKQAFAAAELPLARVEVRDHGAN